MKKWYVANESLAHQPLTLNRRLEPTLFDKSIGRWYQVAAFDSHSLLADIHVSVDTIVQYLRFFDRD
jgi:hypothetical protein